MEDRTITVRVPKSWLRTALIVGVTALIVAPLTAVATHSFTDVPDSNTFHADIEWLKDADVTRGCNPPANTEFCPDDNVTRAQMAAFMRRLAENQVVDAGTLEGQSVEEILALTNSRLDALEAMLEGVSRDGDVLLFEGMNLQVVNGQGNTQTTNGLGNVIVGYNEIFVNHDRSGSHNLVVGPEHTYSSYGGFVAGATNSVTGPFASVSGGSVNTASGTSSSVSGGSGNTANDAAASVSGGVANTASGVRSSVLGGVGNEAAADHACIPTCP